MFIVTAGMIALPIYYRVRTLNRLATIGAARRLESEITGSMIRFPLDKGKVLLAQRLATAGTKKMFGMPGLTQSSNRTAQHRLSTMVAKRQHQLL